MRLAELLKGIEFNTDNDISRLEVKDIKTSSKAVSKGDLFIAFRGYSLDGYQFIDEAISKGAAVVLAEKDFLSRPEVKKVLVSDTRSVLPAIAANFYGHPSGKLKIIGITGTNGKTTITYLIENILKTAGKRTGVIGTINYRIGGEEREAKNTTPGPLELQSILAEMVAEKISHCVMEVSSHGLDQGRVDSVSFDTAIFTNITSEHLDYHKTIDEYFKAKAKLFDRLKEDGFAILNSDDMRVAGLKTVLKNKVMTYGVKSESDVTAKRIKISMDGSTFNVMTRRGVVNIQTNLIGRHNISNILASIAASLVLDIDLETIKEGIESFRLVPGRLQAIDPGQPFKVFIDYAHTPDALSNVLIALREVAKKRVITVFGCGGNRDRTKRPLMGEIACRLSDYVIITSDNPRFEDPRQIISEIENGIKRSFSNYVIIEDRLEAIAKAMDMASCNDIVLIAGKGHEKHQMIKDKMIPFDDCEVAKVILKKRGYADRRIIKDNKREASLRTT